MIDALGWVALAATSIAAIVTAANLGARITGWGFAIFFVGAVAWCAVGALAGQRQLLWSNIFLALVDLAGVWRWLYRRARADDAVDNSKGSRSDGAGELFAIDDIVGKTVTGIDCVDLGTVEGALVDCDTGRLRFLIIRPAKASDDPADFRRLAWHPDVRITEHAIVTGLTKDDLGASPAA